MNQKALVTGVPGWLGTRLVERLVQQGRSVTCFVHPLVDPSPLPSGVTVAHGDVRDQKAVSDAAAGVTTIFHLAAVIHPKWTRDFDQINAIGTRNVLEAAATAGVKRVIFASSNAVQGSLRSGLMDETGQCHPESAYGRSKMIAEQIIKEFDQKISVAIIRSPMFYGPGQPARMTRLMRMIRNGRVPLFGSGDNLRSMSYIENLVDAMLLAEQSPKAAGEVYWISDEQPYTTIEFMQAIAGALGVPLKLIRLPGLMARGSELADKVLEMCGYHSENIHVVGESTKWIACSINKAKKELGYSPTISLQQGLQNAVAWCRERHLL